MRALAAALWLLLAGGAAADPATHATIEAAWRDWFDGRRVGETALAISQNGAVAHVATRSGDAPAPAPLASLSKAITGACASALVDEGRLAFADPVSDHLAGAPDGLTIGQLLTHSGGVWPDATQETMWDWVNDRQDRYGDAARRALARPLARPLGQAGYRYNNENYAILGAVIAAVTGASYEAACTARVLAPLGLATMGRSPRYGAFLPWGGWRATAAEYARFVDATYAAPMPPELPRVPVGGGARYGLGALSFEAEGLRITWHTGLLCFGSIDGAGAYFAKITPGRTVVVTFEGCPGEAALADLDQALLTAMLR